MDKFANYVDLFNYSYFQDNKITSVCMYKDESGLFQIEAEHKERRPLRVRRLTSVGAVLSTVSNIHEAKRFDKLRF